jgi:hypothetical protein
MLASENGRTNFWRLLLVMARMAFSEKERLAKYLKDSLWHQKEQDEPFVLL